MSETSSRARRPTSISRPVLKPEYRPVPHTAKAGRGDRSGSRSPEDQRADRIHRLRADWLRTTFGRDSGDLILEIAVGESMEPGVRDGDALLVDTVDRTFRDFGIYVIEARGERLVKRVQRKFDGGLILISDSKMYPPEPIRRIW